MVCLGQVRWMTLWQIFDYLPVHKWVCPSIDHPDLLELIKLLYWVCLHSLIYYGKVDCQWKSFHVKKSSEVYNVLYPQWVPPPPTCHLYCVTGSVGLVLTWRGKTIYSLHIQYQVCLLLSTSALLRQSCIYAYMYWYNIQ